MPHLTRISVPHQGDTGYSFTPEDGTALDALTAGVASDPPGLLRRVLDGGPNRTILVGRVTRAGVCDLYFYGERGLAKRRLVALERLVPGREFNVADRPDPEWRFYQDALHPGPALPALRSSQVQLNVRKEHGDRIEDERDVDHTLLFPTEAARAAFLTECGEGWRARLYAAEDEGSGKRFGVDLTRTHALDPVTTDIHILFLSSHAAAHGGVYDGWGALELHE